MLISTYYVEFVENALFRSSGNICWPLRPSLLFDQLIMACTYFVCNKIADQV